MLYQTCARCRATNLANARACVTCGAGLAGDGAAGGDTPAPPVATFPPDRWVGPRPVNMPTWLPEIVPPRPDLADDDLSGEA